MVLCGVALSPEFFKELGTKPGSLECWVGSRVVHRSGVGSRPRYYPNGTETVARDIGIIMSARGVM